MMCTVPQKFTKKTYTVEQSFVHGSKDLAGLTATGGYYVRRTGARLIVTQENNDGAKSVVFDARRKRMKTVHSLPFVYPEPEERV